MQALLFAFHLQNISTKRFHLSFGEIHFSSTLSFWGKYLFIFLLVPERCTDWCPIKMTVGWAGRWDRLPNVDESRGLEAAGWSLAAFQDCGDFELTAAHWDQLALLK